MILSASALANANGDASDDGGVTIRSELEPLAGPHAPVKPAGYAGGAYQHDERWYGSPPERTPAIVIENVPSTANRLEAALLAMADEVGLPQIVLDLSGIPTLPPHLPRSISTLQMPHRQADAYLRDSLLDGRPFPDSPDGSALLNATIDAPAPIVRWCPQALLFGYWQSHLGKKRPQTKLARSWDSYIVGYDPAGNSDRPTRTLGVKGDPLNLSVDEQADFNEDDQVGMRWSLVAGSKKEKAAPNKSRKALSEIGHGQVPFKASESALAPVSFRAIEQRATVSFASLRRLHVDDPTASATLRALLVAIGLAAHVEAFGRPFHLRSACDLRTVRSTWTWLGAEGDGEIEPLAREAARALLDDCKAAAEKAGVLDGGGWDQPPMVVTPNAALAQAIATTWPLAQLGE